MTINNLILKHQDDFNLETISLPASKSVANRALIISALAGGGSNLENISEARDTQTMQRLLLSMEKELDVLDAGTTMRFLTAYLVITNQTKVLTGSTRMLERPIGILVEALRELGGRIDYITKEGFPPLKFKGFIDLGKDRIQVRGDVSSQYISAILMIAPLLKKGLKIELTGKIGSRPYIEITLSIMRSFGVHSTFDKNIITVGPQEYKAVDYKIEPDWSAASYWYSFVALSSNSTVRIKDLRLPALQGDSVIVDIMRPLGVESHFDNDGVTLKKIEHVSEFEYDFTDCPDLAQTITVICAAKNIKGSFTGLESLKIKETDRIQALQNELSKIGTQLKENDSNWELIPNYEVKTNTVTINTYDDHRMAMAFAPLVMKSSVEIENPSVVSKSYPRFWEDLKKVQLNVIEGA